MFRKSVFIVTLLLLANLFWPAVAAGNGDKVLDLAVRTQALPSAAYAEALQRDRILRAELARLGWTLRLHHFDHGIQIIGQLEKKRFSAVIVGDVPAVIAMARSDMQAIAMTRHGFNTLVTRQTETLDKLKGKRIAYAKGTSAHFALHEALRSADLSWHDIIPVEMEMAAMPSALDERKVDAFAAWPPMPERALCDTCQASAAFRSLSNDYFLVKSALMAEAPEVVRHLAAAVLRAHHWLQAKPNNLQRAAGWLARETPVFGRTLTRSTVASILQRDSLSIPGLPLLSRHESGTSARLARRLDFAKKNGLVSEQTQWQAISRHMASEWAEEVLRHPVRYGIHRHDYD